MKMFLIFFLFKGGHRMKAVTDGDILWTPTKEQIEQSSVKKYMDWLKEKKGLAFDSHAAL